MHVHVWKLSLLPLVVAACAGAPAPIAVPAPPVQAAPPPPVVAPPAVAPSAPSAPSAPHDPDHARGELPGPDARRRELAVVRTSLDAMYAHRIAKLARYQIDEDALFARADARLTAATTWAAYDAALYDTLVAFHDAHLSYHPPATAAPARGYDAYTLGVTTVLAGTALLVATVEPGSDAALAGVSPGDEIAAIDATPMRDVLARAVATRIWSRPESATSDFAHTWTTVLYPKGDAPRVRHLSVTGASTGAARDVAITPHPAPHHAAVTATTDVGVAVVAVRALEGKARAAEIDAALSGARAARGLVLDLRGDRGGVDVVGDRVVADLVEGTASLGTYRVRVAPATLARRPRWKALVAQADGFSAPQPLTVAGQPAGAGFHGAVAVVVDASCASTCEIVAAALRADLHARIFGATTAGSSGAPVEVTLPASHGELAIPTWDLVAADGHPIEGDGVVPDEAIVPTPAELAAGHDPPLVAALAWVHANMPP